MLVDLTMEAQPTQINTPHALSPVAVNDDHDLALVRGMAKGEEAAMHELYASYGQRLYTYALRLTQDPAQSEDVMQEALVAAWKSAGKFRGEGRVLAWLLGIVHHTALKSLRHRPQAITDEMEEELITEELSPEQQVLQTEQLANLRLSLNELSPEQRAVLELVFYQELSLEEAAQVCGVPLGTVKSRLSYARRKLRGTLIRQELKEVG
jgi:RNA polymerase sigma-70 factor, ECF subfamily